MTEQNLGKVVFLDRDDTINRDVPYCSRPEDFELLSTVASGIDLLRRGGFKVIVITNQSGIARGYLSEETLHRIHDKMKMDLAAEGTTIDGLYYCPHHPDDDCECRKPKTRMIRRAEAEHSIDLSHSYVVGDRLLDVQLAQAVGSRSVMVPRQHGLEELRQGHLTATHIASDLHSAAMWILADAQHRRHDKEANK